MNFLGISVGIVLDAFDGGEGFALLNASICVALFRRQDVRENASDSLLQG